MLTDRTEARAATGDVVWLPREWMEIRGVGEEQRIPNRLVKVLGVKGVEALLRSEAGPWRSSGHVGEGGDCLMIAAIVKTANLFSTLLFENNDVAHR
jgi:hypothetical protein